MKSLAFHKNIKTGPGQGLRYEFKTVDASSQWLILCRVFGKKLVEFLVQKSAIS